MLTENFYQVSHIDMITGFYHDLFLLAKDGLSYILGKVGGGGEGRAGHFFALFLPNLPLPLKKCNGLSFRREPHQ